ncbi:hypothetical protein ZIOFF_052214 [Zingiber officinale]|uniref:Uncharacterized protein n=1 Tax=Zingiber officinale TaxID=94328 RepID=A0A8J5G3K0_ZINOF|nr:hypothetical protein ZIOFF_052214 [Zingiber officinale]
MFTLANMLTTFIVVKDSASSAQFHVHMTKNDFARKYHVDRGLIELYSKVGWIVNVLKVFKEVDDPDLVLLNTMISGTGKKARSFLSKQAHIQKSAAKKVQSQSSCNTTTNFRLTSSTKGHDRKESEIRDVLVLTCPPTTAIAGKESQRVGRAFSSPWSPRAVQALWSLFTNEIKLSMSQAQQRRRDRRAHRSDHREIPTPPVANTEIGEEREFLGDSPSNRQRRL